MIYHGGSQSTHNITTMDAIRNMFETIIRLYKPAPIPDIPTYLTLERLIDAGGEKTKPVYVGLVGSDPKQAIRIGSFPGPVHTLVSFTHADDELKYVFENNIVLVLKKQSDGATAYTVSTPDFTQENVMRVAYKTISMTSASEELDAIAELK